MHQAHEAEPELTAEQVATEKAARENSHETASGNKQELTALQVAVERRLAQAENRFEVDSTKLNQDLRSMFASFEQLDSMQRNKSANGDVFKEFAANQRRQLTVLRDAERNTAATKQMELASLGAQQAWQQLMADQQRAAANTPLAASNLQQPANSRQHVLSQVDQHFKALGQVLDTFRSHVSGQLEWQQHEFEKLVYAQQITELRSDALKNLLAHQAREIKVLEADISRALAGQGNHHISNQRQAAHNSQAQNPSAHNKIIDLWNRAIFDMKDKIDLTTPASAYRGYEATVQRFEALISQVNDAKTIAAAKEFKEAGFTFVRDQAHVGNDALLARHQQDAAPSAVRTGMTAELTLDPMIIEGRGRLTVQKAAASIRESWQTNDKEAAAFYNEQMKAALREAHNEESKFWLKAMALIWAPAVTGGVAGHLAEGAAIAAGASKIGTVAIGGAVSGSVEVATEQALRSTFNEPAITMDEAVRRVGVSTVLPVAVELGHRASVANGLRQAGSEELSTPLNVVQPHVAKETADVVAKQLNDHVSTLTNEIDRVLLELTEEATRMTRTIDAQRSHPLSPRAFGLENDDRLKDLVDKAVVEGRLPSTIKTTPRGKFGIDVYDSATGIGYDLHTAEIREVVDHFVRYYGHTMPDGTIIREVLPLVYTRQ